MANQSPSMSFKGFDITVLWQHIKGPIKMIGGGVLAITAWYAAPYGPAISAAAGAIAGGIGLAVFNAADFFLSTVKLDKKE
jgi:hypothetical protein